jgi:DNA-binding HxlR family transcriptional regulator/putative sterol carrier protein
MPRRDPAATPPTRRPAARPRPAPAGTAAPRRSYSQYCAVARGLDIVGDRWTLLLVRDLMLGPKRYTDLLDGLPGIGTNLLAARLRELEGHGLLERAVLPPPAASTVYRLTEVGEGLWPVLVALGRWGGRYFLGSPRPDDHLSAPAYFVAIRATFHPELAAGLRETYELRIDGRVFEVEVADGACTTAERSARRPDAVFTMDVRTLNDLLLEGLPPAQAISDGRAAVQGDAAALERWVRVFRIRPGVAPAVPAPAPA